MSFGGRYFKDRGNSFVYGDTGMKNLSLLFASGLLMCASFVYAEVYKNTNSDGTITYSDSPTPNSTKVRVYPSTNGQNTKPRVTAPAVPASDEEAGGLNIQSIQTQPSSPSTTSKSATTTGTAAGKSANTTSGSSSTGGASAGSGGASGGSATSSGAARKDSVTARPIPAGSNTTNKSNTTGGSTIAETPTPLVVSCKALNMMTCPANLGAIQIGGVVVGHNPDRISNIFGLHSIFWGVQDTLSYPNGEMKPAALEKLKEAGVDLIRHGGGINEIDWSQCVGPVAQRRAQKVMSWALPVQCRFGMAEYEHVNDQLGAKYSWHMGNIVGLEFKTFDIRLMAAAAKGHAQAAKELANGRPIYWELGNELGDGVQKWSAEKIGSRAAEVAEVIREVDPTAKFIVPLLSFQPTWVQDEIAFNKEVAARVKDYTSGFALHTYYDNPPEGPSVTNRLKRIADASTQLRQQGFAAPELWITEHSRWPEGNTSGGSEWKNRWYQAADFDGVLSSADFIIGLTQLEDVDGAMWHVLTGGGWSFLLIDNGEPVLSPLGNLFKFLQPRVDLDALQTVSFSPLEKIDSRNYALKASALKDRKTGDTYIWAVNRSDKALDVPIVGPMFKKNSSVNVQVRTLTEGSYDAVSKSLRAMDLETTKSVTVSGEGEVNIRIPARAVVNIRIPLS